MQTSNRLIVWKWVCAARRSAEVQTEHRNKEWRWFKWLWISDLVWVFLKLLIYWILDLHPCITISELYREQNQQQQKIWPELANEDWKRCFHESWFFCCIGKVGSEFGVNLEQRTWGHKDFFSVRSNCKDSAFHKRETLVYNQLSPSACSVNPLMYVMLLHLQVELSQHGTALESQCLKNLHAGSCWWCDMMFSWAP